MQKNGQSNTGLDSVHNIIDIFLFVLFSSIQMKSRYFHYPIDFYLVTQIVSSSINERKILCQERKCMLMTIC